MEQQSLGSQPPVGQARSGGETAQTAANAEFRPSFEPVSEQAPAPGEVRTDASPQAPPPPPAAQPIVQAPQPLVKVGGAQDNQNDESNNTNPHYADNVDVIEREWVARAKQIVLETKNSPYQREVEVGKLQADYLQKRYGKQIKLASD
jgi:hypothetical protein